MEPLSSAAIVVSSLIATKAFEKTGEKLGEAFTNQVSKLLSLSSRKMLPKVQQIQKEPEKAQYEEAVTELELATKSDVELRSAVYDMAEAVRRDPQLLEKVQGAALLIKNEPHLVQNQTKLAEKIGVVHQGGTLNIETMNL